MSKIAWNKFPTLAILERPVKVARDPGSRGGASVRLVGSFVRQSSGAYEMSIFGKIMGAIFGTKADA
ncbi:MAG: hypothetical protein WBA48_00430, partial [Xanthobacteraceae bacterium]